MPIVMRGDVGMSRVELHRDLQFQRVISAAYTPTLWPPSSSVEAKGRMRGRVEDAFPREGRNTPQYARSATY